MTTSMLVEIETPEVRPVMLHRHYPWTTIYLVAVAALLVGIEVAKLIFF